MPKKPSKTQEYLENRVIHRFDGLIDLKKLWAKEEDKELDPKLIGHASKVRPAIQH
jgi:hypothetical protein